MRCSYCGEENAEGEKYCSNCGMKLEEEQHGLPAPPPRDASVRCSNCGSMNPSGASVCQSCGEPVETTPEIPGACPQCGFDRNPEAAKFCMKCGNKLIPEESAPPTEGLQPMARLVLSNSREIILEEPEVYIGRADFLQELSPEEAKYISREHLRILYEGGIFYILDEKSTNGTKLNGSSITGQGKKELNDNDTIVLADTVTAIFRLQ